MILRWEKRKGGCDMARAPISDAIIVAVSQMVDDAQSDRRDPSHSDIETEIKKADLSPGDPKSSGQTVGKAKRVRATLNWAFIHKVDGGRDFIGALVAVIRGHGGFRETSTNYVGRQVIENAVEAFSAEGYDLSGDGELLPRMLDNLSGATLTIALEAYIRRAKIGASDAALVTGTSKDLLEAVAAHILQQRYGTYPATSNFPTLLGQTFVALGLATPMDASVTGEPPRKRVERAMYELACSINQLRNKEGTGHGRPWISSVTDSEARMAIESIGVIAERLLNLHRNG